MSKMGLIPEQDYVNACDAVRYKEQHSGGISPMITVTAEPLAMITCTDGVTTLTGQAIGGTYRFQIPNFGTWTVKSGETSETVEVIEVKEYKVDVAYRTYTVKIKLSESNPETACIYADDAVGMTPGYEGWKNTKLFSRIKPCIVKDGVFQYYLNPNNLAEKETGEPVDITSIDTGDVMIEIPKIGYRMWKDSDYQYVSVTENQNEPDYCYRAHSLDAEGDCDKIYIGAFLGWQTGSKLYSLSDKDPFANATLTYFRNYAQAKGTGYQLFSFYPLTLIQCLYVLRYKNLNSQKVIGMGRIQGKGKTGATITKGEDFGNPNGDTTPMCFLNLEDLWGNYRQFIDGVYVDSNLNLKTSFQSYNDVGKGYLYTFKTKSIEGLASAVNGTNESGFTVGKVNGSASTYYCDRGASSANCILRYGGFYNDTDVAGIFSSYISSPTSDKHIYIGCRIMFKHKKEV